MSNARRIRRRLTSCESTLTATWMACCESADDIERCKVETHDLLITELGPRRRSGVCWSVVDPPDVARTIEMMEWLVRSGYFLSAGLGGGDYSDVRAWLSDHPGAWAVVAMCEAVR